MVDIAASSSGPTVLRRTIVAWNTEYLERAELDPPATDPSLTQPDLHLRDRPGWRAWFAAIFRPLDRQDHQ